MAGALIGTYLSPVQVIDPLLYFKQVQAPNGVNQRAIADIADIVDIEKPRLT